MPLALNNSVPLVASLTKAIEAGTSVPSLSLSFASTSMLTGVPCVVAALSSTATGATFGLSIPPVVVIWAVVAITVAVVLHRTIAELSGHQTARRLILDLNFAYNPSCAYDPAWACPLATRGNVLPAPVPVGEQQPDPKLVADFELE